MIDWGNLASDALWITGLAVGLATLSYASWQTSLHHEKLSQGLKHIPIQIALNLAGLLFSAGLAAISDTTLEIALWSVLALAFTAQVIFLEITRRRGDANQRGDGREI